MERLKVRTLTRAVWKKIQSYGNCVLRGRTLKSAGTLPGKEKALAI
jgi:hypothetical protein